MNQAVSIKITLRHYRCFQESSPVEFCFEPGRTIALVGKNNVGKSTLMRFFYELKYVLVNFPSGQWTTANGVSRLTNPSDPGISNRYGVGDLLSLYPGRDASRPIQFSIAAGGVDCAFEISKPGDDSGHALQKYLSYDGGSAAPHGEIANQFRDTLYLGAHRNLVNGDAGGGGYFDLSVGTAFIAEWDHLKNGHDTQKASLALKAEKLIADLLDWSSVSINASSDKKQMLLVIDGTKRLGISELGAGISELVLCIVTAAIKKPSWILIDEPESHLHPSLQVKFVEALTLLASHGVIFTTHSVGLARTCADAIFAIQQDRSGRSSLRPFESVGNFSQLMGELSFSQLHELGFNKLLLCEGVTEVKTLRQVLRLWGLDASVMLVPLGGTSLIDPKRQDELREFNRFGVPVYVIVDSEKEEVDAVSERGKFIALCKKLFGDGHAVQTEYRAIENYFTEEAISTAMRSEKYKPLQPFQNSNNAVLFWGKNQNWRVAAEMTKADWMKTDIGRFIESIARSSNA